MEHIELQVLGGLLYLLNKVFLVFMEKARDRDGEAYWKWRRWAWIVYLLGLPPVLAMFYFKKNWIFGAIELGGSPAMLCGVIAAYSRKNAPAWLDRIALAAIPIGLALSLLDLGISRPTTQGLEILGSAGFLVGTYLLAKDDKRGYGWFFLMNAATAILFGVQGYYLFVPQQIVSVALVVWARNIRAAKQESAA